MKTRRSSFPVKLFDVRLHSLDATACSAQAFLGYVLILELGPDEIIKVKVNVAKLTILVALNMW